MYLCQPRLDTPPALSQYASIKYFDAGELFFD